MERLFASASTFLVVDLYWSRLITITRLFVLVFFIGFYFTRLFIFEALRVQVLLRIDCIWILLICFSFLATQNMRICYLIFIPRNLLMERGSIIDPITGGIFFIVVTLARWKELLIATLKNLKSMMIYNLCSFCWFRLCIFYILFYHLLPSVFWIFLKLCGILTIIAIFINLHLWRYLLIFLVRWYVWFNKIWNNIQISRLVFLGIFNCDLTFVFKMTSILLKIVLICTFNIKFVIWISQDTLGV
jgi:hypothetical protein